MQDLSHAFTRDGATFTITDEQSGLYTVEVTGPAVLAVCPGGGAYTMHVDHPRRQIGDEAHLRLEVLDRWQIVLKQSGASPAARSDPAPSADGT